MTYTHPPDELTLAERTLRTTTRNLTYTAAFYAPYLVGHYVILPLLHSRGVAVPVWLGAPR